MITLAEIARVIVAGVRFGCVLADAGYGFSVRSAGAHNSGVACAVGWAPALRP